MIKVLSVSLLFLFAQPVLGGKENLILFRSEFGQKELSIWVNFSKFGGMGGVPELLVKERNFKQDWTRAQTLGLHARYLDTSKIFLEISGDLKKKNYASLFGWYLVALEYEIRVDMINWLVEKLKSKDSDLNSAIGYMIKNLCEQEITRNEENDRFLKSVIKNLQMKKVKIGRSALFDGNLEEELVSLLKKGKAD
jgi:hypothetical protein